MKPEEKKSKEVMELERENKLLRHELGRLQKENSRLRFREEEREIDFEDMPEEKPNVATPNDVCSYCNGLAKLLKTPVGIIKVCTVCKERQKIKE